MEGLKSCRLKVGFTQAALALTLGVNQSSVADWETGKKYPTADKLPAIAAVLNCTIDALFEPPT